MTNSQVFYRKWRPTRFDEVAGQQHVTQTLKRAITTGRISHAYLFTGPRGVGKTSTARILAKALNSEVSPDGEPVARGRGTCVYRQTGESWEMVHTHWSVLEED